MRLRDSLARLGACALLGLAAFGGTAHAAGTQAGLDIKNSATLDYSVGGVDQGKICSSPTGNSDFINCANKNTAFKVDRKINLTVTTQELSSVKGVPGGTGTMTFILTNTGNDTQGFSLATETNLSGSVDTMFGGTSTVADNFNPTSCTIYNDATPPSVITSVDNVAPDAPVYLKVACLIPLGQPNDDISAVALVATATAVGGGTLTKTPDNVPNDPTVIDVVFADIAGPQDGARDGKHSARHAMQVNTAAILVTKAFATICDPAGGARSTVAPLYEPKSIPGAYVQYTVTIRNAGTAPVSAILTTLTDALDTNRVAFDSDLITGANVSGSPACAAVGSGGSATNANGKGFLVKLLGGTRTAFPGGVRYLTTTDLYTAPNISVNWATVLPAELPAHQAAELHPGESVQLIYNVTIK